MIKIFRALDLDIESIQDGTLRKIGEAKKSPDVEESTPRANRDESIIAYLQDLDDSQKDFLIALLETVTSRNRQTLLSAQASTDGIVPVSEHHDQT